MPFKLTNEAIQQIIAAQSAPPSTGDMMLWGTVDRKERKAEKKKEKASDLRQKYNEAVAAGKTRKAARIKKRMDRKLRKAENKEQDAYNIKRRPDYWMKRDETL